MKKKKLKIKNCTASSIGVSIYSPPIQLVLLSAFPIAHQPANRATQSRRARLCTDSGIGETHFTDLRVSCSRGVSRIDFLRFDAAFRDGADGGATGSPTTRYAVIPSPSRARIQWKLCLCTVARSPDSASGLDLGILLLHPP